MPNLTDLLIVGGGINGAGIAYDASGRGLNVVLCEKNDLASATSSASSKLIHGGLRYLESYEFRLVRESLQEREVLLKMAPHLTHPLEFIMPQSDQLRSSWLIKAGLFLYDNLGGRDQIPGSKSVNLANTSAENPLSEHYKRGFSYFDCQTDDARLVIANAIGAQQNGAKIMTQTKFISAERHADYWLAHLQNTHSGETQTIKTRVLINAAGPWVEKILKQCQMTQQKHNARLVKGSHIVVEKLYKGNHAYILQHSDKRIIFTTPFQDDYTMIGTTDVPVETVDAQTDVSAEEINYLCQIINGYFKKQISADDIKWQYWGVRALYDDNMASASTVTRDYMLDLDTTENKAPLLSIFGGKITTYRKLAEHVLNKLSPYFIRAKPAWTTTAILPGGELNNTTFSEFQNSLIEQYSWLPETLCKRYARSYGVLTYKLLENCRSRADLGHNFGENLYEREVIYLIKYEWAKSSEDILWRRTKIGLNFPKESHEKLDIWLQNYLTKHPAH